MLHGMVFTKLNKAAKSLGKEENKLPLKSESDHPM